MRRRAFLAASGTAVAALSGCLGVFGGSGASGPVTNGDYPADPDRTDGIPPVIGEKPQKRDVNTSAFNTIDVNGETVRLAPIEVTKYWYDRANTRFVDARGSSQYERSHIYGAVNSTAQRGSTGGGIEGWAKDDRIVAYCGCPHHLSSVRAAGLQKAGYENVFVINEGFWEWHDRGYPMKGADFEKSAAARIEGRTDPSSAGEYAWATALDSGQEEAAPIGTDGTYELELHFDGMTADTTLRVDTPDYSVTDTLAALTSSVVTG